MRGRLPVTGVTRCSALWPWKNASVPGLLGIGRTRVWSPASIENRPGRPELAGQVIFRSNDNGTILGLAAEGVGVAVISWLSVDPHRSDVRVRRLAGVSPRVIGIAWHRDRYRIAAAEAFVRLAQQESLREHRSAAAELA
jgi:DNA-binding transcriptional LysR family regulator